MYLHNNTLIIYHSADLDGHMSAMIAKDHCEKFSIVDLFPIDYGETFPWDKIEHYAAVVMLDYSLPVDHMMTLLRRCDDSNIEFVWIDHHARTVREIQEVAPYIPGLRNIEFAACELTWQYYHPDKEVPPLISIIGAYDIWNHNHKTWSWDEIEAFQYRMRSTDTDPSTYGGKVMCNELMKLIYRGFDTDFVETSIEAGFVVVEYIKWHFLREFKNIYHINWKGYDCAIYNGDGNAASFICNLCKCDIGIVYHCNKGKSWNVSLRSNNSEIDLSAIAKECGGGGHKSAAGFNWMHRKLPWEVKCT